MLVRLKVIMMVLSFSVCAFSGITVHNLDTSKKISVETVKNNNVEFVVLSSLCEVLGYAYKYNVYTREFICSRGSGSQTIIFIENNKYVVLTDSVVVQLQTPPTFLNGVLCIPYKSIPELFSTRETMVQWGSDSTTFIVQGQGTTAKATVPGSKKGIVSVHCSVKQNGTLLTIALSDSLPFEYMYYHPSMILNFFGGVVDTTKIKILKKNGIVQSVSSIQFKESAQISITLSQMVEEPVFDYVQDTKTVMVSLRPLKQSSRKVSKPVIQQPRVGKKGTVIVIDPGHGGKDPGAIGFNNIKEKDVALSIALDLRDLLKDKTGIKVLLTRDKDVFVPLSERTQYANENNADLFISIHADAVPGDAKRKKVIKGYKIYFLSQAKNEEDKLVAMRENAVIKLEEKPQNYSNLQNVLIDIAGNEYLRESQDLCILVDQAFGEKLGKKLVKLHLGVGQANFWVLNGAYMPSVLVETGFLSNPDEAKLLYDKTFQKSMALALSEAIVNFTKRYETGL